MNTNRKIVYSPSSINSNLYTTRTVTPDQKGKILCYDTKEEAIAEQQRRNEIIKAHYRKHEMVAMEKLDKIEQEIKTVLANNKAELYFSYEGDSHGIYSEGMELSVVVNGFEYTKKVEL